MKPDEYLAAMRETKKGTAVENVINSFKPEDVLKPFGMTKPDKSVVPG